MDFLKKRAVAALFYVCFLVSLPLTRSALFSALQLAVNVRHFRFNRVNRQRLYWVGFSRPCVDGLQQGIEMGLPSFERVRPSRTVLNWLVHYVYP